MSYNAVQRRIWRGNLFASISEDARHAAMYLLTTPFGNTEGLFHLPLLFAAHEMRWNPDRVTAAWSELREAGWMDWDGDIVLIRNALEHNIPKGEPRIKGAAKSVSEIPAGRLLDEFAANAAKWCPQLAAEIADMIPLRGGIEGVSDTPSGQYSAGSETVESDDPPSPDPPKETPVTKDDETPAQDPLEGVWHTPSDTPSNTQPLPLPPSLPPSPKAEGVSTTPRPIDEKWEPPPTEIGNLEKKHPGFDHARSTSRFVAHNVGTGRTRTDWTPMWRLWIREDLDRWNTRGKPSTVSEPAKPAYHQPASMPEYNPDPPPESIQQARQRLKGGTQ